jgi:antitoxin component YwqK of YwqJK toxin-antitoxin module
MKIPLVIIVLFLLVFPAFAQQSLPKNGFTNKAEAKNKYVDNLKQGKWIEYIMNRKFNTDIWDTIGYVLSTFDKGKAYGKVRSYYYKSGKLWKEFIIQHGKINGIYKAYYESGKLLEERNYTDGKINGIDKQYYEDGKFSTETPYTDDTINGVVKEYDEDGKVVGETPYAMGKLNGVEKDYGETGKNWEEATYKNGRLNGVMKVYYRRNGSKPLQLMFERYYTNDTLNGLEKWYNVSGALKMENNYVNGVINGTAKYYYDNGKLESETTWDNGKQTAIRKFDKYGDEVMQQMSEEQIKNLLQGTWKADSSGTLMKFEFKGDSIMDSYRWAGFCVYVLTNKWGNSRQDSLCTCWKGGTGFYLIDIAPSKKYSPVNVKIESVTENHLELYTLPMYNYDRCCKLTTYTKVH